MAVVRTIAWVLLLVGLVLFSLANWQPGISVRIWSNLVVDTRLPAVVVISFLLGFVPMWLFHRGVVWRLKRRLGHLETATAQPVATAARLDADRDSRPNAPVASPEPRESDPLRPAPARPTDSSSTGFRP